MRGKRIPRGDQTATLTDVAAAAGVSPATASRVLGKEQAHLVRQEVQEQVRAAAQRLHYRADYHASALRRGRSRTVALMMVVNELPISSQRLRAMEREVWARGYDTMLLHRGFGPDAELEAIARLLRYRIAGVIYSGSPEPEVEQRLGELDSEVPVITLFPMPRIALDCVMVDRRLGAYLAARHLIGRGHRRLGGVMGAWREPSGPPLRPERVHDTIHHRLAGLRQACAEAGLSFDEGHVTFRPEESYAAGYHGLGELWARPGPHPTALICANDQVAIGALRACQESGVRVPQDVALVGFDNLPEGAFARVALTTLEQPIEEEARRTVERLFERLANPRERGEPLMVSLPPRLIVRESSGPPMVDG